MQSRNVQKGWWECVGGCAGWDSATVIAAVFPVTYLPLSLCFPDREACKNIRKPSPTCPRICKGPAFFKLSICFFKTNFQWVYADILVDLISIAVLYFLLL